MSLMHINFESQYLANNHEVAVILPDKPRAMTPETFYRSGKKYRVLWLLHGTYGDQTDWVRKSNIELYAEEKNLVVVMPPALNSNYSNWNDTMMGFRMYDYLTEELMPMVYGWLPVSDRREDNFIAGLSMGGRGTIKYAVNHPERFAAAAVLSAAPVDMEDMREGHPNFLLDTANPRMRNTLRNAGGLDEIIEDNVSGLKVPVVSADGQRVIETSKLAESIYRLLDDRAFAETIARHGRKRYQECFSSTVFSGKMVELYKSL